MPFTEEDVQIELDAITKLPGWQQPEKRGEFVRDVALKTREGIEPDFHSAVIGKLWEQVDDRNWARKKVDFVGTAVGEVVKSMPAWGAAVDFALADAVGLTNTGSGTRLKEGVNTLIDATGQRLKQAMPGKSAQAERDEMLEALRLDIEDGAVPPEFDDWLGGKFDNSDIPPAVKPFVNGLTSDYARRAVLADHGEVTPEKLRAWQETDRNPGRSGGDIPGQPGPRDLLYDFAATKDPASWAAFKYLVTETDAQHQARLRKWVAGRESAATMQAMPEGLGKEMVGRAFDMQGSPIDLAASLFPMLRGARALNAARTGGMAAAIGSTAMGAAKEGLQEGATEMLSDPRATAAQIGEAAAMGAVGSGVLEGAMGTVGAGMRRLATPADAAAVSAPVAAPSAGSVSPLGNIAAGTFKPESDPASPAPPPQTQVPPFKDDPLNAATPPAGGNLIVDYGIAKSPNAQAVADAAEQARQQQEAKMRGVAAMAGNRMPVIPDSPLGGRDILDFVNDNPLYIPRKGSKDAANAENDWSETYDVPLYYRKFIASSGRGHNAADLAHMAYEENYIQAPTADALMDKINETIRARTSYKVEFRKREQSLQQEARQVSAFENSQARADDKTMVALEDVNPGDEMTIEGHPAVVKKVEWDEDGYLTNVVIEDGKRYGVLSLDPTTRAGVFVDEWKPKNQATAAESATTDPFSIEAEKTQAIERAAIATEQSQALSGTTASEPAGGFTMTQVQRDLRSGVMTDAFWDGLLEMAETAVQAGRTFAQWTAEMVKRFGEDVRAYLSHLWAVAKDRLITTSAAQNVRMGSPAQQTPVKLGNAGSVINLLPRLKGGTHVFHKDGQPFRVNFLGLRQILTGSPLPKELVPILTRTQNEKRALEQRAAQLGKDLQKAIDAAVGRWGVPMAKVNETVADMLKGDLNAITLLQSVDPVLYERTRAVRVLLDHLSSAVAQTLPVGDLRTTITDNLGSWLRRSYAAFDPASGWNYDALVRHAAAKTQINGQDAATILRDAQRYLHAQNPGHTKEEIEADLRDLMDRDTWESALTGAGARKSVGSLMQRKVIAPEIRAVMGEENNPVKLLTSSAGFQAQFIARHHGQEAMRRVGLATGLFSQTRGGVYTEHIPVEGRRWSGMAGIWTTPQMWKALENAAGVTKEGSDLGGLLVTTLKALGNKAKLNRVALNPDSWLVNMLGNFTSLIANGDVFSGDIIRRVNQAREISNAGDAKSSAVVNAAAEALRDAQRDMMARLTEAGVLGSSITFADIEASVPKHLLQWLATDQKLDRAAGALEGAIVGQALGRSLGAPGRVVGALAGAAAGAAVGQVKIQQLQQRAADILMTKPDALARTTGWLTNYETALLAGMSPDVASQWATTRTLNTFPNYAALPGVLREGSRLGILGSFIAFQYEVYRNFAWNVVYAVKDLSSGNPALIQRGAQRLAGIGAVSALAGGGLAATLAATGLAGADDERNQLFRKWFGAPWEKDAVLAFSAFDKEKVSYYNTSYLLPQTTIAELAQAVSEGQTPADAASRVMNRLYEQFVGGSVHLGPLLAAIQNENRGGRPISYEKGIVGAAERADYAMETILEPGYAAKLERLAYALRDAEKNGKKFSVEEEFKRFIGIREQTRTWPRMMEGAYRGFAKQSSDIRGQANQEIGLNRPGAVKRAVDAANQQIQQLRQTVAEFEKDARKLGVPESVIQAARREASLGKLPSVAVRYGEKRVSSLKQ